MVENLNKAKLSLRAIIDEEWFNHKNNTNLNVNLERFQINENYLESINNALQHLKNIYRFEGCSAMPEENRDSDYNHSVGTCLLISKAYEEIDREYFNQEGEHLALDDEQEELLEQIKIFALLHDLGEAIGEIETVDDVRDGRKIPNKGVIESTVMQEILYLSCIEDINLQELIKEEIKAIQEKIQIQSLELRNEFSKKDRSENENYVNRKISIYRQGIRELKNIKNKIKVGLNDQQRDKFVRLVQMMENGEKIGGIVKTIIKVADIIEGDAHISKSQTPKSFDYFNPQRNADRIQKKIKQLSENFKESNDSFFGKLFVKLSEQLSKVADFESRVLSQIKDQVQIDTRNNSDVAFSVLQPSTVSVEHIPNKIREELRSDILESPKKIPLERGTYKSQNQDIMQNTV